MYIGTTAGVDGDAFATRDVPNDLFATNRIATSGAVDEQVILSFDLQ